MESTARYCTAFEENRCIAAGDLSQVALKVKALADQERGKPILVFDDLTSELIELDLRGSLTDVLARLGPSASPISGEPVTPPAEETPRGPGRPRLGVVAREVTLLPRHWDWLTSQSGGASVALRKLVEEARRTHDSKDRVRHSQEAGYRFMSAIAGHQPGFEEASRALFAGTAARFDELVEDWPKDVRDHVRKLLAPAFEVQAAGHAG